MKKDRFARIKMHLVFSWKDTLVTAAILGAAVFTSSALKVFDENIGYAPMVFILAVLFIARFTQGYLYGIAASLLSVLIVNYIYTYPFFSFNFMMHGYPIAIIVMLTVSITTSALITKLIQNEQIRVEAELEKMKSNLLRAVSHDLRTPLTGILGSTTVLIENDKTISPPQRVELLQEVSDDAQWLIRMVENLLTITRMDNDGAAQIQKVPEIAEEVIADAVTKFKKRFPEFKLSASVPDELLIVPMDQVLIVQVLMNLAENAVLHGGEVSIIKLKLYRDGNDAVFSVIDDGQGISPTVMPHLFDSYMASGSTSESDTKRNMGIGLSVCRTIIEAHGGTLTGSNRPEGGAEFTFRLPLEEEL